MSAATRRQQREERIRQRQVDADPQAKLLAVVHHATSPLQPISFTTSWFNQWTRPLWEQHFIPRKDEINHYLEIGVHEGRSLIWALEALELTTAFGIDPYIAPRRHQQHDYDRARDLMARNVSTALDAWAFQVQRNIDLASIQWFTGASEPPIVRRVQVSMLSSAKCLKLLASADPTNMPPFDLAFVDGSHHGANTLEDAVLTWPLIRRGGYMILDDYNRRWQLGGPRSHEGIDAFLSGYESLYDFVYREPRQIAIRKR